MSRRDVMNTSPEVICLAMTTKSFLDNPILAMQFRVKRIAPLGSLDLPHFDAVVMRSGGYGSAYTVFNMRGEQVGHFAYITNHTQLEDLVLFLEKRYSSTPSCRQFEIPQITPLMPTTQAEITAEVVRLMKVGLTDEEIAVAMNITKKSVQNRLNRLRRDKGQTDLYRYEVK